MGRFVSLLCRACFLIAAVVSPIQGSLPLIPQYPLAGKRMDPLRPPFGLKTYGDLGLMVDESLLACELPKDESAVKRTAGSETPRVFPLSDKGNRIMLGLGGEPFPFKPEWQRFDNPTTVWCSYSKDKGVTWSEPRFLAALVDASPGASIKNVTLRKGGGETLSVIIENNSDRKFEVKLKEYELRRLATIDDLLTAPPGRFVLTSVPVGNKDPWLLAKSLCVGTDIPIIPDHPPDGYQLRKDLGLLIPDSMEGQVVHTAQSPEGTLYETRVAVTPGGDYLVFIPDGSHGNSRKKNANILTVYRSRDQGLTWEGPSYPFGEGKHFGVLPVVPKNSRRLFVFESHRDLVLGKKIRERTFGYRSSDDDGRTWSPVQPIKLDTGSYFSGVGVIPMSGSKTSAGTVMAGFHHGRILRGESGADGWKWSLATSGELPRAGAPEEIFPLDELQVVGLEGANALAVGRTCEGHLWEMRSNDDGRTWHDKRPTSLVHPDAPPMIYKLSDGRTLIALHHNRAVMRSVYEPVHSEWAVMPSPNEDQTALGKKYLHSLNDWVSRAEIWFSLSRDGEKIWSEPRFLLANAFAETLDSANANYQCSYVDLFADRGFLHLIMPHRWQQVVHLRFPEDRLETFPTRDDLLKRAR